MNTQECNSLHKIRCDIKWFFGDKTYWIQWAGGVCVNCKNKSKMKVYGKIALK